MTAGINKRRSMRWGMLMGLLMLLSSCGNENRLVVFADPWYGAFPERALQAFQEAHPDASLELRLLSSEVVAQRIRYDDPIDIFLCLRPGILREYGLSDRVVSEVTLADLDLVLATGKAEILQPELGGTECWSVPADGRPLRHYVSAWEEWPADSCILIADFCRQTQDYPLRGWTRGGYLPGFFARKHADRLQVLRQGPKFSGAFTGIRLREAPHAPLADAFMDFLRSEKCKTLLAEEKIID